MDREKIIIGNMGLTFSVSPYHIFLPKTPCQKVIKTIVCHYRGPVVVLLWCRGGKKCNFVSKAEFHLLATVYGMWVWHLASAGIFQKVINCSFVHVYRIFVCVEQSSRISDNLRPKRPRYLIYYLDISFIVCDKLHVPSRHQHTLLRRFLKQNDFTREEKQI